MTELNLPELNQELLINLVTWAYADNNQINSMLAKFPGWGGWSQEVWAQELRNGVCKTSFCMAGQTVVQAGYKVNLQREGEENGLTRFQAYDCYPVKKNGFNAKGVQLYKRTGPDARIPEVAQKTLGLIESERYMFFNGDNSIEQVIAMAVIFARVRGIVLEFPATIQAEIPDDVSMVVDVNEFYLGFHDVNLTYQILFNNFGKVPELV